MPTKINKFYGAILPMNTVSTYYPANPDFDSFVFQQMIVDGAKQNDDYNLIAYAVFKTGSGSPVLLALSPLPQPPPPVTAGATVQFANFKLDTGVTGLQKLYPTNVVNSDITITPIKLFGSTGYIVYTAQTTVTICPLVTNTVTLNPSPPA